MASGTETRFPNITQPLTLRGKRLRSRVYLPAHQPGLADEGRPGERYIEYHRQRARAGLGMQITGATPVLWSEVWADGLTLVNTDDSIIPGYRKLSQAVHDEGGLMLAQLAHVGAMETTGTEILSASWTLSQITWRIARAANAEELEGIIALFRSAALRCREGGLDGVEVTMAHGMLLASFLSPAMNRRDDRFGGDVEGRTLFPRQVVAAVREAMGPDAIVGIRISADEMVAGGLTAETAAACAARIEADGLIDYVSVTAGNNTQKLPRADHWPPTPAPFGAFRHLSRVMRGALSVPVATVGRVTTIDTAEEILRDGDADLVGMVRANVADYRILPLSLAGRAAEVRPCIGANVCINALLDHRPLTCMVNPDVRGQVAAATRQAADGQAAVVIGGGPAGLEAARRLAGMGYDTTLMEAGAGLGGQMQLWSATPSRTEFLRVIEWWKRELDRLGVKVVTGQAADVANVTALDPAMVVLATGSQPYHDALPGADGLTRYGPYDVSAQGGHVLVRDEMGRLGAMLIAEKLSLGWDKVTLVTSAMHPGEGEGLTTTYPLIRSLGQRGVEMIDRARVVRYEGGTAIVEGVLGEGRLPVSNIDAVVSVLGMVGETGLLDALRDAGLDVRVIGDAHLPRDVTSAVADAAAL
ncbi:FAD-dependent oxidoreductase [Komagataeibacter sp. FNDCF1]|uniref:oxidoreductase n=1 Tax=Komagataeibacter sp. FNDCF1 TaxID=2878681 RepID=UPI001E346909|nr:FAD-dependent oxidoreductase [Komagataeibacter sp. FNDCF1]MCE2565264.1 FAD-dependent oxidoreductase [Komagataeibacter sp. FNDCF1]